MTEPAVWSEQVRPLATAPLVVALPYIDQQRAEGWPDMHPEHYCHRCGGRNISWWTDADTWQKVMPSPDPWNGIVCVNCFGELAEQIAPLQSWHLQLDTDTRHAAAFMEASDE